MYKCLEALSISAPMRGQALVEGTDDVFGRAQVSFRVLGEYWQVAIKPLHKPTDYTINPEDVSSKLQ